VEKAKRPPGWAGAVGDNRRPRVHGRSSAVLLVLLVVLGGCHAEPGGQPPSPVATSTRPTQSTAPPSTTIDPRAAVQAAVVAAYRAYWADVVAASQTADWRSPRLDDHARGQPVQAARDHLLLLRQQGLVARGDMRLAPRVVLLLAGSAKIQDCQDLTGFLKHDAKTGALRDRPSGNRYLAQATLTRFGDQWKVTHVAQAVATCGKA
jgi:hypothetical protein